MKHIFTSLLFIGFISATQASELFVRVQANGNFYALAGNQTQINSSNTFRFFDLSSGSTNIQIINNDTKMTLHNSSVYLSYQERVVAEIDSYGQISIIHREQVTYSNWYTENNSGTFNSGSGYSSGNSYGNSAFQEFLKMLDNESFDSRKLEKAKEYANKARLSAGEIAAIATRFTYDSNRLEWAKHAYTSCYDPANYFLLESSFTYSTSYSDLERYIKTK